jgi:hypothetical protein
MTCETVRAVIASGDAWPAAAHAHLAGCEACALFAVEWTLQQAPPFDVPATFAADVVRRARLGSGAASGRSAAAAIGFATAALLLVAAVFASVVATNGALAALPAGLFLLASGEAIVLAAWSVRPGATPRS